MLSSIDYFNRRKLLLAVGGYTTLGVLRGQNLFAQEYSYDTKLVAFNQQTQFIPNAKPKFYPKKVISCKDLEKVRNDILKRKLPSFTTTKEFELLYSTATSNFNSDIADAQKQYDIAITLLKKGGTPLALLRKQQTMLLHLTCPYEVVHQLS